LEEQVAQVFTFLLPVNQARPTMRAHSMASDIQLDKLLVSAEQRVLLEDMYHPNATATGERISIDHLFKLEIDDQLNAGAIIVQHGLDLEAREDLEAPILRA
jgi:hypothetical protein